MKTLIKNVRIITPYRILENYSLLIKNKKIYKLGKNDELLKDNYEKVIDGNGKYLSPGFIDIHTHGNSGFDILDGTEEALDNINNFNFKHGVTSFLGTIITSSLGSIRKAIENIDLYKSKNKNILGAHLEGPFLNKKKKGAQPESSILIPNIDALKDIIGKSENIKMVTLAPELKDIDKLVAYLKDRDIIIALGHSDGKYEESKSIIDKGGRVATHLYNGMREFNHREPGIVGAVLEDNRVYCELIYDRVHVHDIAVKLAIELKGVEKIILISDSMRGTGLKDGVYELGGQDVIVKDNIARLESGNLAGSLLTLDKAVYNLVNYLNISLIDAVRMASLNPAKALKVDDKIGSIEVGKDADLILIDDDINIYNVFLKGKEICLEK